MSRIIVKQLPKNITEAKIRSVFGSRGTITDLQLKYTADGKFRQFCFIGYRNETEAQEAVSFFNNTCIQASRIKVELCTALGSADSKLQSWNKRNEDSIASDIGAKELYKKDKQKSKIDEIIGEHKNDPDFKEFLKAHDKKRIFWANDAAEAETEFNEDANKDEHENEKGKDSGIAETNDDDDAGQTSGNESKLADKPISDLEYMKSLIAGSNKLDTEKKKSGDLGDLYTIKIHNVPYNTKRQDILKFFKPFKPYSVRLPAKVHGFCYVGFKTEKDMSKAMLKNKSFIKGKQVFFSDFTEKNKLTKAKQQGKLQKEVDSAPVIGNPKWKKQLDAVASGEGIAESGRIFFRNLAYTVTEEDLQTVFEQYGPVAEIQLPVDGITRQIKGFGTVTYVMPEHAVLAFNKLDGTDFHGRLLHLIPAKSNDNSDEFETNNNNENTSYKQEKALKLKKSAQQSVSWNALFLGANAVADILAEQHETTKANILDTEKGGSSAAVRMALGETQIVMEMKKFLEDHGVCLSAIGAVDAKVKRSKCIMLVKNLPSGTTVAELTEMFAKYGPLARIVLPPSGVTAIVEYCNSTEARSAFSRLAYSKFKHVPLFLEWAPENIFQTTPKGEPIPVAKDTKEEPTNDNASQNALENDVKNIQIKDEQNEKDNEESDDDGEPPGPMTTLFLHNLNFKTEAPTVREHFKHLGPIYMVEIAKRKDTHNPKQLNSLGYGFIQFKSSVTADQALKHMQHTTIDGNVVELKRSDRVLKSSQNPEIQRKKVTSKYKPSTKILLRNIPFQAKAGEIRDIFKVFGEIRSLRLPLKSAPGEPTHRGFGFIDFMTKSDAKKAFKALSQSTHLYGRRLVLEWAASDQDNENLDELRKRTANQFESNTATSKRSKKAFFNIDLHMETDNSAKATAENEGSDF